MKSDLGSIRILGVEQVFFSQLGIVSEPLLPGFTNFRLCFSYQDLLFEFVRSHQGIEIRIEEFFLHLGASVGFQEVAQGKRLR